MKLNRDWAGIDDVLGTAIARLDRSLRDHVLRVEIEPGLPLLRLDFVLAEQVFVNLLDNASRYSPAGTPIRLHAYRSDEGVTIDVEDRGRGVPPADLERIFDKFYRVEHGDRQIAGTGLGLSICRGIVEEHRGRIIAISPGAEGIGTIFRVTFPIEPDRPTVERAEGHE
jgi:two-component system sensor histidine kinase KdpD